jgi:UDP-N-acetylglucosamine--N-acetylmuramyl-(pentapeptide) pyrophosphoryl-undecaprenol N-acetylglucosamine transferase
MRLNRIIISGGGTGGHIFPAVAIADAVKKRFSDADILFVGALGRMEMQKVPAAGYPIEGLEIEGIKRNLSLSNLLFPVKLWKSYFKAAAIIKVHQPQVVVGTGGFASGPTLLAAWRAGVPVVIQEQNSYPGITNRFMGNRAARICVAYPGLEQFFPATRIRITGNPVRNQIEHNTFSREKGAACFGLRPDKPIVFIYGGSQGALAINRGVDQALESLVTEDIQVIWQTGKSYVERARFAVQSAGLAERVFVSDFIEAMDAAYACCDLVICRAGAISVSEICIQGLPSVLVPLPTAAEDHQTKNARVLAEHGAAEILRNEDAPERLGSFITRLLHDEEKRRSMGIQAKNLAVYNSAEKIVDELIQVAAQ